MTGAQSAKEKDFTDSSFSTFKNLPEHVQSIVHLLRKCHRHTSSDCSLCGGLGFLYPIAKYPNEERTLI